MNKYKVEFLQTESFIVDIYAKTEKEALTKATKQFNNGLYQETGDIDIKPIIYDVTNTDDSFNPMPN